MSIETPQNVYDLTKRIAAACDIASQYGQIDGSHHKTWVIDQMVRILLPDTYVNFIKNYESGEDGPKTYSWDIGISP